MTTLFTIIVALTVLAVIQIIRVIFLSNRRETKLRKKLYKLLKSPGLTAEERDKIEYHINQLNKSFEFKSNEK